MSKYKNIKTAGFDSKKEMRRYQELKFLERAGEIRDLRTQVKFELIPHQVINGRVKERAVNYIADFVYTENGKLIVEDVKSPVTKKNPEYVMKRKLMLFIHGVEIREI